MVCADECGRIGVSGAEHPHYLCTVTDFLTPHEGVVHSDEPVPDVLRVGKSDPGNGPALLTRMLSYSFAPSSGGTCRLQFVRSILTSGLRSLAGPRAFGTVHSVPGFLMTRSGGVRPAAGLTSFFVNSLIACDLPSS